MDFRISVLLHKGHILLDIEIALELMLGNASCGKKQ